MAYSLQAISDRMEIEDLLYRYCDAVDQQRLDDLDDVFTPDAKIDYSAMGGASGSYPEVKEFLRTALPAFVDYFHMIGNIRLKIDGDTATGRVMGFNPMGVPAPDAQPHMLFLGIYYVDRYIRSEGGWRICERVEQRCWGHNVPEWLNTGA